MTRRNSGRKVGTVICAALLLGMSGIAAAQTKAKVRAPAKSAAPPDITPMKSLGSKSAPIKMEVFSDFQCPACRELYFQTVRQVIDNYVSAGKVYLIHRDMPLPIHPHSREAARYANAAARVGRMEKVVGALFDKQPIWAADGNVDGVVAGALTRSEIIQVRKLVKGGTLEDGIEKDVALGNQFRVTQTPTTIITCNGKTYPWVGVVSYKILKSFFAEYCGQ